MTKKIIINKNTVLKQIELTDTADIFNTVISQREYLGKWLPFVEFTKEIKDTENFVRSVVDTPEKIREFVF
ncbi:MAG TPA: N-acetyltransferase, partial [bacterium]|nr:N-acetyltransferase [bacterium]